jgi:hypothetical protein
MKYIRVGWSHENPAYPVLLYSELDRDSWEVRKVEVYSDGRMGHAAHNSACGGTKLGIVPTPPLAEIASDPQFDPAEISAEEFESIWNKATGLQNR